MRPRPAPAARPLLQVAKPDRVAELLATLASLGQARTAGGGRHAA